MSYCARMKRNIVKRKQREAIFDLTGKKFNRWTVLARWRDPLKTGTLWTCKCDCGTVRNGVNSTALISGRSSSCGCYHKEQVSKEGRTDGYKNPAYALWCMMKQRCYNPKTKAYPLYGGRGITVCQRWRDSFQDFIADMGERPPGFSIDRIDNEKGYFKENCRWVPPKDQSINRRKSLRLKMKDGTETVVYRAAKEHGVSGWSLKKLTDSGMGPEEAIETLIVQKVKREVDAYFRRKAAQQTPHRRQRNPKSPNSVS